MHLPEDTNSVGFLETENKTPWSLF
jgi:hypothetical protein